MTVQGPPSTALVTRKHLHVTESTVLITIMPQPHKTPHDKDTKGLCDNNFWKVNHNPLPPICFGTLNTSICPEKV